jgi:cyclophilin family peptidyl-prolyl cis-trans isomerase
MNIFFKRVLPMIFIITIASCSVTGSNENTIISIQTTSGTVKLKLYDNTPVHRDNFISLINSGFYEGISFHRVIKDFMIQAGDPLTKTGSSALLIDSMKTYTLPAEINNLNFHKKGALAAARQGSEINPELRSSGTQFYIVQGVIFTDEELNQAESRINANIKQDLFNKLLKETADSARLSGKSTSPAEIQEIASVKMFEYLTAVKDYKIPEDQRNVYKTIGGTPRLDGTYTVFGEVIEGLEIVDKIASVQTDINDKPVTDVKILKIKILKN